MDKKEREKQFDYWVLHKRFIFAVVLIVFLLHSAVIGSFSGAKESFFSSIGVFSVSWASGFFLLSIIRILLPKISTRRFFKVLAFIATIILSFRIVVDMMDAESLYAHSAFSFGFLFAVLSICELYYVKKKSDEPTKNAEKPKEIEMLYTNEQSVAIAKKVIEQTSVPAVKIKAIPESDTDSFAFEKKVCASRFGGLPYWEAGERYPTDSEGNPLYLLAQINFAELPHIPDFPTQGLLQFFIANDEDFGCSFSENQENWRVIFHEDFDAARAMSEKSLRSYGVRSCTDEDEDGDLPMTPLDGEFSLSFSEIKSPVNQSLYEFDDAFSKACKTLKYHFYDINNFTRLITNEANDILYADKTPLHQLGGYPYFSEDMDRPDGYVLLFQMDSDEGILWGKNSGVAHFLIPREDLLNLDFSHVFYTWDSIY